MADEVRKLAEQSQSSANQISELIVQIQNDMTHSNNSMEQVKQEVQNGLGIVSKTQSSFDGILGSMDAMGNRLMKWQQLLNKCQLVLKKYPQL